MLAGWIHQRQTDPRLGEMLATVAGSELVRYPLGVEAVNVREWRRDYDRATKIPQELAGPWPRQQPKGRPPGSRPAR